MKVCDRCQKAPRCKNGERFCQSCKRTVLAEIRPFLQPLMQQTRDTQKDAGRYGTGGDGAWDNTVRALEWDG